MERMKREKTCTNHVSSTHVRNLSQCSVGHFGGVAKTTGERECSAQ
jgi:hypothetical protein